MHARALCFTFAVGLLTAFLPASADGQAVPVHELRLVAGWTDYPLDLEGWLVAAGHQYDTVEISPPAFGKLLGESYRPDPELWIAGVDHFSIEIRPAIGAPERHDFLVRVLSPTLSHYDEQTFEGGWPADWSSVGSPGAIRWEPAGISGAGLRAFLGSAGEEGHAGPTTSSPDGSKGYHAQGTGATTIPDPPDLQGDGVATILSAEVENLVATAGASVEIRLLDGVYSLRARVDCFVAGCRASTTPWREIPDDRPVRFELWSGPMMYEDGRGDLVDAVRFSIDQPAPLADSTDWIEGTVPLGLPRIGFQNGDGLENIGMTFDDVVYWEEVDYATAQLIVADGFEDGGFDPAWSTVDSPVEVAPEAAIRGAWGTALALAEVRANGGEARLVTHAPTLERQVRALFQVDLAASTLAVGERIDLLRFSRGQATHGGLAARLLLRATITGLEAQARVLEASGQWRSTPWHSLGAGGHQVALGWRAGHGDGLLELWIDGQAAGRLVDLDNGDQRVETVGIGVLAPALDPGMAGTSGLVLLDEVILTR